MRFTLKKLPRVYKLTLKKIEQTQTQPQSKSEQKEQKIKQQLHEPYECIESDEFVVVFSNKWLKLEENSKSFRVHRSGVIKGVPIKKMEIAHKCDMSEQCYHLFRRIGPIQHTDLWFSERMTLITASNSWRSIKGGIESDMYINKLMKLGIPELSPIVRKACDHGSYWEEHALKHYEQVTKNKVIPVDFGLVGHQIVPWLAGSPDGIVGKAKLQNGDIGPVLLEIKCPYFKPFVENREIPTIYYSQVQQLMEIFNLEEAHFFEFYPADDYNYARYNLQIVPRNRTYYKTVLYPACRLTFFRWQNAKSVSGGWHPYKRKTRGPRAIRPLRRSIDLGWPFFWS